MDNKLLVSLLGLTALGGCAQDWDCRDLDPIPYGKMTTEMQVCDWGTDDFDKDNEDIIFLKLKNAAEEVVCEGELNPTDIPFEYNVNSFSCDVDKDGAEDFVVKAGTTLKYTGGICFVEEEDDREVKRFCDVDNDAVIDWAVLTKYDGNKKIEAHDSDYNGIPETVKEFVNDELVKESLDYDQDERFETVKEYIDEKLAKESKDKDGDGIFDTILEYNDLGLVSKQTYIKDGKMAVEKMWYDDQGREILTRTDLNNNGVVDFELATIYGDIKVEIATVFKEGIIDNVKRTEHNPDGRRDFYDDDANGVFEYMRISNDIGVMVVRKRDYDQNNEYEEIRKWDDLGNQIQASDLTEGIWHHVYWEYDVNNNAYIIKTDWDGDGNIDVLSEYSFSGNIKETSKTTLFTSTGLVEAIYHKSIYGNQTDSKCPKKLHLMDADVDLLGDGTIDYILYSVCNDDGINTDTEKIVP
jgi:hypothetical protein